MGDVQPKKRLAIFGSTGSIGTQALDVVRSHQDMFEVEILTAQTNDELLVTQAMEFNPNAVVIGDEKKYAKVKDALSGKDIKVFVEKKHWKKWPIPTPESIVAAIVGLPV
ncbi:MAG: hypothetical protein U0T56_03070 [Ferruginibacter sp.]